LREGKEKGLQRKRVTKKRDNKEKGLQRKGITKKRDYVL